MRIIIAPQAFKGNLSAFEVAGAIRKGVKRVFPNAVIDLAPVADGGDGTLEVLKQAKLVRRRSILAQGAFGEPVQAEFGVLKKEGKAIIELAAICGMGMRFRACSESF